MHLVSKKGVTTFLDRFLQNAHLDAQRILRWYSYLLLLIPLLFWAMLAFNAGLSHRSLPSLINREGMISVGIIIATLDFVLGYYLWLSRGKVLTDQRNYHFFMLCQVLSQLLVGNLICTVLALFGLYQAKQLELSDKENMATRIVKIFAGCMLVIFIICSIALLLLLTRK